MIKLTKAIGMISVAFFLAGCQSTEEETDAQNADAEKVEVTENETENNQNDTLEEASENKNETANNSDGQVQSEAVEEHEKQASDEESDVYSGGPASPNYFIQTHPFDHNAQYYTAFSIQRDSESEKLESEERLLKSLVDSDPSGQDILDSYADLSLDWPNLTIQFSADGSEMSTSSAQSVLFFDTLYGIIDYYGIEEVTFLNPDGVENVTLAERLIDEPVMVQEERGLTRGYYTIYNEELEETLFLPGGMVEEQVKNEKDEPLSFEETLEVMTTIDREDAFYESAIVDGIEVTSASLTNGVAQVVYSMDEDKVSEEDRKVFENALQFVALDFQAWEIDARNETIKEYTTYHLVGQ